jgi:peptidoglycan/LPS O-acetylase OafA/YrhL
VLSALGLASSDSIAVDLAYIVVGTALSFLAAAASFRLFEVHFLNLKDRFAPPTPKSAPVLVDKDSR